MSDLSEWLIQILDEDEKRVHDGMAPDWSGEKPRFYGSDTGAYRDDWGIYTFHVAPERVLADIAAKRAIIDLHDRAHECSEYDHTGEIDSCSYSHEFDDCSTLRLLASAYADRPGYDEEWKR